MLSEFHFFPELREVYACANSLNGVGTFREEAWIPYKNDVFPITSFSFGSSKPEVPKLVIIGGVHGLEKIGTHVVTSYLQTIIRLLKWDDSIQKILEDCQLIFYPLANPVGMYCNTRSNGNGVDLMRNAPIEAKQKIMTLVGGHRISAKLPWYRGPTDYPMELETEILCDFIKRHTFSSDLSIVLDVHSGFGLIDRLWFPFAFSTSLFPDAHRVLALKKLLDHSYPHHIYTIEPQNIHYMAHGDVWDYLYFEHQKQNSEQIFIPLCLEMGSWHWVRKNPRQALSLIGMFNPMLPHRLKRTQRRHLVLFDFLLKAINSGANWARLSPGETMYLQKTAKRLWYAKRLSPLSFKN
ncbi:MAG: M14 family zinc carboxypeptidase [Oligoflexus sp.]